MGGRSWRHDSSHRITIVKQRANDLAEFEPDLIRLRTRQGMKVAKAKGRLRGKQPSSTIDKKLTSWPCSKAVSTAPRSSPTCSASPALPSIGQWGESELATSWASAPRSADGSLVASRRHPCGTPPPSWCRSFLGPARDSAVGLSRFSLRSDTDRQLYESGRQWFCRRGGARL
jgi:hypothetical protein